MEAHQYRKTKTILVCFFLFTLFLGNLFLWKEIWQGNTMRVVFFDVGQGDAIFLKTSYGHTILIDGGPGEAIREKVGKHMLPWEKKLDLVILTHPDLDHIAGLNILLEYYDPRAILQTGAERETKEFDRWKKTLGEAGKRGSVIHIAKAGQRLRWTGTKSSQFLDILHPFQEVEGRLFDQSNDTGVVARLSFYNSSIFFAADVSKAVEEAIVQRKHNLKSDILKVAHHGSKYSSSPLFVEAVNPLIAVISSGRNNRYHHPAPETLATFEQYGIEVRRTDMIGDISYILFSP